jgi:hypothetical protein
MCINTQQVPFVLSKCPKQSTVINNFWRNFFLFSLAKLSVIELDLEVVKGQRIFKFSLREFFENNFCLLCFLYLG